MLATKPDGTRLDTTVAATVKIQKSTSSLSYGGSVSITLQNGLQPVDGVFVPVFNGLVPVLVHGTFTYGKETLTASKLVLPFTSRGIGSIGLYVEEPSTLPYGSGDVIHFAIRFIEQQPRSWYYLVTSRGRITSWAAMFAAQTTFDIQLTGDHVPQMTVIVYTITDSNWLVAASCIVNVQGALRGQVAIDIRNGSGHSTDQVNAGDQVTIEVNSSSQAYVGLLAVDQSMLFVKRNNDITNDQLIKEMVNSTAGNNGSVQSTLPQLSELVWTRDGSTNVIKIFSDAGLMVMTDANIYTIETVGPSSNLTTAISFNGSSSAEFVPPAMAAFSAPVNAKPGSSCPVTWIWASTILNDYGQGKVTQNVPATLNNWTITAFSISTAGGLVVSDEPLTLVTFPDISASVTLPESLFLGEEAALQLCVFNYAATEQFVSLTLLRNLNFTARLNSSGSISASQDLATFLRVSSGSYRTVALWITPLFTGNTVIMIATLSANGVEIIKRDILVKPEGYKQSYCISDLVSLQTSVSYKNTLSIPYPSNAVKGSRGVKIIFSGDIMGLPMNCLDKLVQIPVGCGEQNMIKLAPSIFIMQYAMAFGLLNQDLQQKTLRNIALGYQSELNFWRKDGFFSAFGEADDNGSIWLTAFVLKSFRQALPYAGDIIDADVLETIKKNIMRAQSADGTFVERGRIIHGAMQGGIGSGETLSAYVLIALLEGNPSQADIMGHAAKTVSLLENSLTSIFSDRYKLAIATYALTLANSSRAPEALMALERLACVTANGMMYWSKFDEPVEPATDLNCSWTSITSTVEMTAYGLLTYVLNGNAVKAHQTARWLISKRHYTGGFYSTQDTVLALQALAAYASFSRPGQSMVNIKYGADGGNTFPAMSVNASNQLQLNTIVAAHPDTLTNLTFTAVGSGLATISVCETYYSLSGISSPLVELHVTVSASTKEALLTNVRVCATSTSAASNGMGVMEVNLPSGFSADIGDIVAPVALRLIDNDVGGVLVLYFDEFAPASPVCVTVPIQPVYQVKFVKNANVKAYHYYMPDRAAFTSYNPIINKENGISAAASTGFTAMIYVSVSGCIAYLLLCSYSVLLL